VAILNCKAGVLRESFLTRARVSQARVKRHCAALNLFKDGAALTITEESGVKITSDSPYGELKTNQKGKIKLVYKRKM
jgi:hypothetical protein